MKGPRGPLAAAGRILGALALGMLGPLPLWPLLVAHLVLPPLAALHLLRTGPGPYLADDAPRVAAGLGWLVALHSWAALEAERLPLRDEARPVATGPAGARGPSPLAALGRLVTGVPGALLVLVAGAAALAPWVATAVLLAAGRPAPAALGRLPAAAVRRHAAWLTRQASLPAQALSR